jgi:hypothetical protein
MDCLVCEPLGGLFLFFWPHSRAASRWPGGPPSGAGLGALISLLVRRSTLGLASRLGLQLRSKTTQWFRPSRAFTVLAVGSHLVFSLHSLCS